VDFRRGECLGAWQLGPGDDHHVDQILGIGQVPLIPQIGRHAAVHPGAADRPACIGEPTLVLVQGMDDKPGLRGQGYGQLFVGAAGHHANPTRNAASGKQPGRRAGLLGTPE